MKNQWLSSSTYVAAVVFLVPMILFYWEIIKDYSEKDHAEMAMVMFFRLFWIPNLFVVPLLTMKCIAEERRLGTLETMMTMPISAMQLVFSKFVSAMFVYTVLWLMAASFPFITAWVVPSIGGLDQLVSQSSLVGCLVFVLISGASYISIGVMSSSLTRSQLVAGMLSFTGVFIATITGTFLADSLVEQGALYSNMRDFIGYLQTFDHFEWFSQGVLDLKPFIFYVSVTAVMLIIAASVVDRKT
ncbi:MAG: ABC transporter permease subunit [Opitutales bacterium]|nr:ABC transporter permease subunit [Opitutales bacterium]